MSFLLDVIYLNIYLIFIALHVFVLFKFFCSTGTVEKSVVNLHEYNATEQKQILKIRFIFAAKYNSYFCFFYILGLTSS